MPNGKGLGGRRLLSSVKGGRFVSLCMVGLTDSLGHPGLTQHYRLLVINAEVFNKYKGRSTNSYEGWRRHPQLQSQDREVEGGCTLFIGGGSKPGGRLLQVIKGLMAAKQLLDSVGSASSGGWLLGTARQKLRHTAPPPSAAAAAARAAPRAFFSSAQA